jgi:hypothetical protein
VRAELHSVEGFWIEATLSVQLIVTMMSLLHLEEVTVEISSRLGEQFLEVMETGRISELVQRIK